MELIKESQRMLSPGAVIVVFSSFLEVINLNRNKLIVINRSCGILI